MESLLFACCLENSRYDKAEEAFARIQTMYFDWNEIRVATARELAESFEGLADPLAAARNLKRTLQSIFETLYRFDLEDFKKQNLGQAVQQLQAFPGTTKFTVAYVVQHALGGHSIPLCLASLEIMRIVGAISESEFEQGAVPGLERAIPKDQGHDFSSLLHQLGYEFMHAPSNSKWRSILLEIAPDAKERFVRRPKPTVVEPKAPDVVPVLAVPSSAKKKETTKPPLPAAKDEAKPSGKPIVTPTKNSTTEKLETKSIPAKKIESKTAAAAQSAAKVAKAAKPIAKPKPKPKLKPKSKPKHPTAKKAINKNKSKAPSAPKKPTPAKGKKPGKNVAGAKSKSKSSSRTLARKKPR
ncbi:MAG: hypothetical protein O2931_13910 [Planctomycetota bacterium]|nr:hypothetical protein [Planctomycetota bacterium]